MISTIKPGVLTTLESLHESNPPLFDKLVTLLATRPEHGEITLRFRDRKLFVVERHETHR